MEFYNLHSGFRCENFETCKYAVLDPVDMESHIDRCKPPHPYYRATAIFVSVPDSVQPLNVQASGQKKRKTAIPEEVSSGLDPRDRHALVQRVASIRQGGSSHNLFRDTPEDQCAGIFHRCWGAHANPRYRSLWFHRRDYLAIERCKGGTRKYAASLDGDDVYATVRELVTKIIRAIVVIVDDLARTVPEAVPLQKLFLGTCDQRDQVLSIHDFLERNETYTTLRRRKAHKGNVAKYTSIRKAVLEALMKTKKRDLKGPSTMTDTHPT